MPELPEVETIVRRLRNGTDEHPPVVGETIASVEITWDRIIAEPEPDTFRDLVRRRMIKDARRRGKYLHFPLDNGHLMAHLRMSGDMRMEKRQRVEAKERPVEKYDRVIINFESNWRLVFSSIRKFGRMWYVDDAQSVLGHLGPEPLSDSFTPEKLYEMLQGHSRQIKPLLMDQSFIAGLGNVYTDEALYKAKIHPLRRSDTLSREKANTLHRSIQFILTEGIRRFGASIDWMYRGGEFQNEFRVYGKDGVPCPECGTTIVKIKVGQRGTHLCPSCQEEPQTA